MKPKPDPYAVPVSWSKVQDEFLLGAIEHLSPTRIAKFLEHERKAIVARAVILGVGK